MNAGSRLPTCFLPVACLLAVLPACRPAGVGTDQRPLVVVVSGDTDGWIVPCGCASNQSGGLPRRGTYLGRLETRAEVLYLDAGGAAGGNSAYDRAKFEAILHGEMAMQVAAHNIGRGEAALGADYLRSLRREIHVPLVSCNVRDHAGELLGDPVRLVRTSRGPVAVIGVLSPSYPIEHLEIDPPREAILKTLAGLEQPDVSLIVLAYLPTAELEELAANLPEADLVVGGPTSQSIPPRLVGPTLLASATNKGKYLAELVPSAALNAGRWSGTIVEMDERFHDDAQQQRNLRRFYAALADHDFTAVQTSFVTGLRFPDDFLVAGTDHCRQCHQEDCRIWDASAHAHAWATLADTGAEVDPYCQQCHTTSYGLPGGFLSASRSPDRRDVGCESCHGPSLAHGQDTRIPTAYSGRARDHCLYCHDRENSPEFEYQAYWDKIVHGAQPGSPGAEHSENAAGGSSADPNVAENLDRE